MGFRKELGEPQAMAKLFRFRVSALFFFEGGGLGFRVCVFDVGSGFRVFVFFFNGLRV